MFYLRELSKAFAGHRLFENVSWSLAKDARAGLVGPNGTGKTTLLRMLCGEVDGDGGTFVVPQDARVGYLPQEIDTTLGASAQEICVASCPEPHAIAAELRHLEAEMAIAAPERAADLATAHAEKSARYQLLQGATLQGTAMQVLNGLGFTEESARAPLSSLSGGWGMRAHLAALLVAKPQLLLLDEPTNHLDLTTLEWLEAFLLTYDGAWLAISHDRTFLNRTVREVAELSPEGLRVYPGNYEDYLEARAARDAQLAKETKARVQRIEDMRAFVTRFGAKATKARQAQSRAKTLERLQNAHREAAAPSAKKRAMALRLAEPPRSDSRVCHTDDLCKRYGDKLVYDHARLTIHRGERLALIGPNGAGKSTLLKLLAGVIEPDAGAVSWGHNVIPYYFAQHQSDALCPDNSLRDELAADMPDANEAQIRGLLGAFLFPRDAADKKVAVLSGGEKSRLALAKMLARPVNFLLLDEPTNHLDLESRGVLEAALSAFSGAMVLISHDRYFVNAIATHIVDILPGGRLRTYVGDYDAFLWRQANVQGQGPAQKTNDVSPEPGKATSSAALARQARKAVQRHENQRQKQAQQIEDAIGAHEARVSAIDTELSRRDVYTNAQLCASLADERQTLENEIAQLYDRWEDILDDLNRIV